jgi:aminopeptidase S
VRGLSKDEVGVEPTVMKIMAGIILLAVGLGIGVALYQQAGTGAQQALSFSVNINPTNATIGRPTTSENMITTQVTVQSVLGYSKLVTLSATGVPTGVSVNFSPPSGNPEFGSTMTVSVDNTATLGATTITIRGTGADGVEKSATFLLLIQ